MRKRITLCCSAVVVSSRQQDSVDAAVQKLQQAGVQCCGIVCHVAKAQHRQQLIDRAVQVRCMWLRDPLVHLLLLTRSAAWSQA